MNISIPTIPGLRGPHAVPGDKSISHRALMIGAIAGGRTEVQACSRAADPMSTLSCVRQLGVEIEDRGDLISLSGQGRFGLRAPSLALDAGNSGTTMRLFSGILVGQHFPSMIIGDASLSARPMKRIIEPLRAMGADIHGSAQHTAPLVIHSVENLRSLRYVLPVPSAQVKSAVLFAGLFADGETSVTESVQSRDHTERMLGLETIRSDEGYLTKVSPDVRMEGKKFFVPGDLSAASFYIAAALLVPGSSIRIVNVGLNPTRRRILDLFRMMNGTIEIENDRCIEGEILGDIVVHSSHLTSNLDLRGRDIVELIDEIPILAVTALFAEGGFQIHDARELRGKETDRIAAIVRNLRALGCAVEEYDDGFSFEGNGNYSGASLPSYHDHRIAMSFGIAGLRIPGISIEDAECVDISFPGFWQSLLDTRKG